MKSTIKKIVESILAWAAKRSLAISRAMVVGVTGSAGKTSTKEAIGHVLMNSLPRREVRIATGNLNTEFGLPLAILGISKPEGGLDWFRAVLAAIGRGMFPARSNQAPIYVLEYGAEQPGDIKRLTEIAKPTIAVVTNVGSAHTQFLGSIKNVAREKGALVRALPKSGLAILNGRDKLVKEMALRTAAKVEFVSADDEADLPLVIAAAVATHGLGVSKKEVRKAAKGWQRPLGRLNLLPGVKGSWLIDDTYNANPLSTTLALNFLKQQARKKKANRMIAVLGDMLELGQEEFKVHKGVALLAERVADIVILVGPRFRQTKQGTNWFPGPKPATSHLLGIIEKGDMILIKGSQSMRMEKITAALLKEPKSAREVLVRQSDYWHNKPYLTP